MPKKQAAGSGARRLKDEQEAILARLGGLVAAGAGARRQVGDASVPGKVLKHVATMPLPRDARRAVTRDAQLPTLSIFFEDPSCFQTFSGPVPEADANLGVGLDPDVQVVRWSICLPGSHDAMGFSGEACKLGDPAAKLVSSPTFVLGGVEWKLFVQPSEAKDLGLFLQVCVCVCVCLCVCVCVCIYVCFHVFE